MTTVRLELQGGRSCPYDHIQIFDGANAQSNQLARLCGTQRPQDITSNDNSLYIVFTSDSSGGGEGFKATYTFESGKYDPDENGVLVENDIEYQVGIPNCQVRIPNYKGHVTSLYLFI